MDQSMSMDLNPCGCQVGDGTFCGTDGNCHFYNLQVPSPIEIIFCEILKNHYFTVRNNMGEAWQKVKWPYLGQFWVSTYI